VAVDLPGHGNNPVLREEITLASYVDHVCSVIDTQSEPVILVGHSLGGMTISQAAEDRADKIKSLVFLAAMLPRDGESRADVSARVDDNPAVMQARVPTDDDLAATVRDDMIVPLFYGDCSDGDIATAKANLVPQASEIVTAKVHLSAANYGSVPRVFIECLKDGAIPIEMQRQMVAAVLCQRVITMDTSHSPFFSAPKELTEHLLSL
jgi:pimeloyl-ACP methyl ester carboxylesterase